MPSHASSKISKVLVANRGEIAVRVIRAAKDAGLAAWPCTPNPTPTRPTCGSPTRRSRWAARPRPSPTSYFDKLLDAAAKSGANAIHPGYGFLSENADFAQAVIDAGLIWIGPARSRSATSATRSPPGTSPRAPRRRWCPAPPTR